MENAKQFIETKMFFSDKEKKYRVLFESDLRDWFFSRQKEIDEEINREAKELGIEDGWKELTFLLTRRALESDAWREFCEALK